MLSREDCCCGRPRALAADWAAEHPEGGLCWSASPDPEIGRLRAEVDRLRAELAEARADMADVRAHHTRAWEVLCIIGETLDAAGYPQLLPERALRVGDGVAAALRDLAEARATLENERGEGEPPVPGWSYADGCWSDGQWRVWPSAEHSVVEWNADRGIGEIMVRPTARAAMRAASEAR